MLTYNHIPGFGTTAGREPTRIKPHPHNRAPFLTSLSSITAPPCRSSQDYRISVPSFRTPHHRGEFPVQKPLSPSGSALPLTAPRPPRYATFLSPSGFPGTVVEGYCSAAHTTPHPWRRQHCRKWHRSRSPPRGTPVPGDSSSLNVTFAHHYNSMAPQEPPNHPSQE